MHLPPSHSSMIITLHPKPRTEPWVREILLKSRLAHLATSKSNIPHVIPVCYTYNGQDIYTPIDEKPKRLKPQKLRRITNITANPKVCIIVDHYEENWKKLRFIMIPGHARVILTGKEHRRAVRHLRKKYPQYRSMNLEKRPIIKISPSRLITWKSSTRYDLDV